MKTIHTSSPKILGLNISVHAARQKGYRSLRLGEKNDNTTFFCRVSKRSEIEISLIPLDDDRGRGKRWFVYFFLPLKIGVDPISDPNARMHVYLRSHPYLHMLPLLPRCNWHHGQQCINS
jgi:hypothetical protein